MNQLPNQAGIGLRGNHYKEILSTKNPPAWLEVHSENFFAEGRTIEFLKQVRKQYIISLHGVSLSLGSYKLPSEEHLRRLKKLIDLIQPAMVSEHISWSEYNGIYSNDLLPLPYNQESLDILCRNIDFTQNFLGQKILIENPSIYLEFKHSTMSETEFINQVIKHTQCGLLFDVNNVYVNSQNHNSEPYKYIDELDCGIEIGEIHLAGHTPVKIGDETILVDTHGDFTKDEVWDLYRYTINKFGPKPTLIEWDTNVPPLETMLKEAAKAEDILAKEVMTS